jgi:hypothetical protein
VYYDGPGKKVAGTYTRDGNVWVLNGVVLVLGGGVPPYTYFEVTQNKDGKTLTISRYKGSAKNIIIPEKLYGLPVTVIGGRAFYQKGLTGVIIPEGVATIGGSTFNDNQLTSVTIPNSVITIEASAFQGNQLTSVTIPDSVTTIGDGAFSDNRLTSITIAKDVKGGWLEDSPGIGTGARFEESFINFYTSQGHTPGTYVKNGPIWSKK